MKRDDELVPWDELETWVEISDSDIEKLPVGTKVVEVWERTVVESWMGDVTTKTTSRISHVHPDNVPKGSTRELDKVIRKYSLEGEDFIDGDAFLDYLDEHGYKIKKKKKKGRQ